MLTKAWSEAKDEVKVWHFYLGGIDDNPRPLSVSNDTLIVAALEPDRATQAVAGVVLPRIDTSSRQWIVVAAANATTTRAGIEHLVASGLWPRLAGQAVSFGVESEQLHTRVATERTYVLPQSLPLQEIRPMLGGFMSDNIIVSAASLMILIVVLGLSTHALIKQLGVREQ